MKRHDPERITHDLRQGPLPEESVSVSGLSGDGPELETPIPAFVGRYRVDRLIGKGGFGAVYLAYDSSLERPVAVKVPHAKHLADPGSGEEYLAEARVVARLDHRHIVPVYDVGHTDEFPCFIVSKFVDGTNLFELRRRAPLTLLAGVTLIADVAEALHFAHRSGVVHRDVKPGNILIALDGTPYLADFGLALREENLGHGSRYAGTPAYMSPEQARGEGHRVDGRSDIYSLGVTFYELLTNRRPFNGGSTTDILEQIATTDPRPPRQIDDRIPRELERICLKAIAPRMADRYTTALDFAVDLRRFCEEARHGGSGETSGPGSTSGAGLASDTSRGRSSSRRTISVVPKGLRSFDEHDSEFFVDLLPGPRDRDGLPASLRFWKGEIESRDPSQTFSVGLLYGPSGCGKSSLVKAGLLPRLSAHVLPVYLEATPEETETRLLQGIQRRCRGMQDVKTLKEALFYLRRGMGLPAETKILIVLDQFEQWLHSHSEPEQSELAIALRQCDGVNVQCLILVRDDFWMATTRFMAALEAPLVEGKNSAAVDLFPVRHAEKVLVAFGRALGCLPEEGEPLSSEQRQFVSQAVSGLGENGKVICVRLAVFAAMMQGKAWTPAGLRSVGGASGVGVSFLRETFEASTAAPSHRLHQNAARAVLKALLPTDGLNLKGEMKSRRELLELSGYGGRPREFDELLRVLDGELRLITPTDRMMTDRGAPEGASTEQTVCYQLTHDYLVPALREWLTSCQRQTRRGRAELLLSERAAIWTLHPTTRHLPSAGECVRIVSLTSRERWTDTESRMMSGAAKHYGRRLAVAGVIVAALVGGGVTINRKVQEGLNESRIEGMIGQLLVSDLDELPKIASALDEEREAARPRLLSIAAESDRSEEVRLKASYALVDETGELDRELVRHGLDAKLPWLGAIIDRLSPAREELREHLWSRAESPLEPSAELRLGVMLAQFDPEGAKWKEFAPDVAESLLVEEDVDFDGWVESLKPVAAALTPVLVSRLENPFFAPRTKVVAARALARLADTPLLCQLLLNADAPEFVMLCARVPWQDASFVSAVREELKRSPVQGASGGAPGSEYCRRRNAALLFMRLGVWEDAEPLLVSGSDPTARSMIIHRARAFGVPAAVLVRGLEECRDSTAQQALILALGPFRGEELSSALERDVRALLRNRLEESPYQAERSAAEWVLRGWGLSEVVDATTRKLAQSPPALKANRDWMVHPEEHVFRVVEGPVTFQFGAERDEPKPDLKPWKRREITIPHSFAISVCEVTLDQIKRFRRGLKPQVKPNPGELRLVGNTITYDDAIGYCRWLGQQEGLSESDQCYTQADLASRLALPLTDEQLKRPGYRLPTEMEWEYICRGGSLTYWNCGTDEETLKEFEWTALDSRDRPHPVGTKRPNAFGFFDTLGNVAEWCHPLEQFQADPTKRDDEKNDPEFRFLLCGGYYRCDAAGSCSATRYPQSKTGYSYTGFRIARTIEAAGDGPPPLTKAVTPD